MNTRRDDLLAAAIPVIARTGVDGMTLRPLARALGTSDRMLVYHFGSRENLVKVALERSFAQLVGLRTDRASGGSQTELSIGEKIRDFWQVLSAPAARDAVSIYLQASALAEHRAEWRDMLRGLTVAWLSDVASWFDADASDRALASLVSATIDGLLLRRALGEPRRELDEVVEALIALLGQSPTRPISDR